MAHHDTSLSGIGQGGFSFSRWMKGPYAKPVHAMDRDGASVCQPLSCKVMNGRRGMPDGMGRMEHETDKYMDAR